VGETLTEARAVAAGAGKTPGRRSGAALVHPLEVPPGNWDLTLRTTWVEPGYVETDASWCRPGGEPATPLGNGGAFGGKLASVAPAAARELAGQWGRPVRVLLSRDDVVRMGPKRPPMAAGVCTDGSGVIRVVRTPGIAAAIAAAAPRMRVEEVDAAGPPTSAQVRAAGWAEAAVLMAAVDRTRVKPAGKPATGPAFCAGAGPAPSSAGGSGAATVRSPSGATATAEVDVDGDGLPGAVRVELSCGDPLDPVVLRSYAIGAAHMALGWVCSEGIAVDGSGVPQDLTIRSFGILRARDTPPIDVVIDEASGPAVNGSDAVFAAVAAATWLAQGLPSEWPTRRGRFN
jgi:CO/xanthine dehydrogenase Mo-binding subunit